ncbi:TRM11 family SAM-dependent methyltransferase [Actinomycetota bacterium Odt1-20B]
MPCCPASVWNTAPTPARLQRGDRYVPGSADHPAKMLPALAAHAITTYTRPGDLVLDPMCGIGTTLVEALHLGRNALGVEYEPRWAKLARDNVIHTMAAPTRARRNDCGKHDDTSPITSSTSNSTSTSTGIRTSSTGIGLIGCGDARHLTDLFDDRHLGKVDLVVTSPPYGSSVHGQVRSTRESGERGVTKTHYRYSHDPTNLAHVSTDQLLNAFTEILAQCRLMLRPGGTVVVSTRPWRERGELIDLPSAVLAAGRSAGLTPTERCVALLAGIRDSQLVTRPSFFQMKNVRDARRRGVPLSVIQHEDVLVFTKPTPHDSPGSTFGPAFATTAPHCTTRTCHKPHTTATYRSRTCARARACVNECLRHGG